MTPLTDQKLAEMKERNDKSCLGLISPERLELDRTLLITEIDRQRKEIEELKKDKATRIAIIRATNKLLLERTDLCVEAHSVIDKLMGDSDLDNDESQEMQLCQKLSKILTDPDAALTAESEGEK